MKSLKDINVKGKRVLMRVDFNVPLKEGKQVLPEVADDTRIRASLPSINYVIKNGGKLILMSHLGRPKGKKVVSTTGDALFSLKPVADSLSKILGKGVKFMPCCIAKENELATHSIQEGDVMLLENTRFHPEEEKNDLSYAKELAKLGDVYVNDAFGSAHRAHASVEAVAHCFQEKAVGFLMEKEVKYLAGLLELPRRPFITVLGGAKVSDKIEVMQNLLSRVDRLLLGGGMVFTFFKSMGYGVGKSLLEEDKLGLVSELLSKWRNKILLPKDIVIGDKFDKDAEKKEVSADKIEAGWIGLDIGKKTLSEYEEAINSANTIFWNGPMGVFEFPRFEQGTRTIASKLAELSLRAITDNRKPITVIGGGDTIAAVRKFGYSEMMTHISTGGGASLEFLAGQKLPGVEVLK